MTRKTNPKTKQRQRRMRGKGDYSDDVIKEVDVAKRLEKKIDHLERSLVKATPSISQGASLAGRALGSIIGQGDLGALAGSQLSKLFGYGDYKVAVKGNSLMAGLHGPTVPKFSGDGKRGVRLTEREFLGNVLSGPTLVSGSTTFNNNNYPLIPTDETTFPWLSKIAHLFDQWEPHGIVFEFVTTSSAYNGSSQALGAVIMATDYDPTDPTYASKQVMENADYACSSVPSANLVHGIECDPNERPLQIMYTDLKGTPSFSSLGNFQVATQGMSTAGTTVGELWVSYDITFYKKQLASSTIDVPFVVSVLEPVVAAGPYVLQTDASLGCRFENVIGVGTDIYFPPSQGSGLFLFTAYVSVQGAGTPASLLATCTNCTVVSPFYSTASVGDIYQTQVTIQLTAPDAKFRIGLVDVNANAIIRVTEVPALY